jgi:4-hydroxyphenylacetate 3-monooxygenase
MTRSGKQYLEGLSDGRAVFLDGEPVGSVTSHPAFAQSARSIAALYDIAHDPANTELMTFVSPVTGDPVNRVFEIPTSAGDLASRRAAIQRWAEATVGHMGRSPDHVASFLTAFAAAPDIFARGGEEFARNVARFHAKVRDEDLFVSYVIVPPQIDRSKPAHQQSDPHLYAGVLEERDGGIVVKGAQMLGTSSALSDYILLSCIHPLREGDEDHAISVAVPVAAPGVRLYPRRSYAAAATSTFDYPLSSRFDETDSLLVFDEVFVPWEDVFVYRDRAITHAQFFESAAHALGNHQAQVRFAVKLRFLAGLAWRIAHMNGIHTLPPVQGTLGEIAGYAALVEGLVRAQEQHCEIDHNGVARPGRAELYANMMLQSEILPKVTQLLRELCGGGLIQLPSSARDLVSPHTAPDLWRYVQSPGHDTEQRVKLLKLAWDAVGSEFAGRHQQYEMFYAGAPFVVKGHMFRNYDFEAATQLVDDLLASYSLDEDPPAL